VSPKFSKDKGQTPQSEKVSRMTPKLEKGQATTPQMQKEQRTTPQSHSGQKQKVGKPEHQRKSETPPSKGTVKMPLSHKSPKNIQQSQTDAGSAQKTTTPTQPKAGTPTAKLQSLNKKRKLDDDDDDDDSSSYDSAEDDFEVTDKYLFTLACFCCCYIDHLNFIIMLDES